MARSAQNRLNLTTGYVYGTTSSIVTLRREALVNGGNGPTPEEVHRLRIKAVRDFARTRTPPIGTSRNLGRNNVSPK